MASFVNSEYGETRTVDEIIAALTATSYNGQVSEEAFRALLGILPASKTYESEIIDVYAHARKHYPRTFHAFYGS